MTTNPPRKPRLGFITRGTFIAVLIAGYSFVFHQPSASFRETFLLGALIQVAVICVRRFVPADSQPAVMDLVEMLADGVTVLLFALGVFGGILRPPDDI